MTGIFFMLLASASFATMAAFVKALGTTLPVAEMILIRCLLPLPFCLAILLYQGKPLLARAWGMMLLRSLAGFAAMACFYYALTHMPLAECVFLGRTQPLLLALAAPLIVREKAPPAAWVAIFAGLAGVFIIMQPDAQWRPGAIAALGGAALSSLAHLFVRRLNRTEEPLLIVFNFFILTAIFSGVWASFDLVWPSPGQWKLLFTVALFATLGQVFMTFAYRYEKAPVVAASSYVSIFLSIAYGYLFWGEVPGVHAWLGGLLILLGSLFLIRSCWRRP